MAVFALVDANNFYATCEKIFQPKLQGRPLVVLSNNDGCIVARSAEAKAMGIPMGAPIHEWRKLCHEAGVVIKSSNYALYGDMSRRMLTLLQGYSPHVESYSIDESFLDLSGFPDATGYGRVIRANLIRRLKITCGVGIGPSKTLAKFANHIAKKELLWGGVFNTLDHPVALLDELMANYPVTEVWGVGRRIGVRLNTLGIHTVLDLRRCETRDIRREFGVVLERTVRELNGLSCLDLELLAKAKQEIMASRSFPELVRDFDTLRAAVTHHASSAAERLRTQHGTARAVYVSLRTNPFRTQDLQYSVRVLVPLLQASADTRVLVAAAVRGLEYGYRPGYGYKKVGVLLADLGVADRHEQNDLFVAPADPRQQALMQTLDQINRRFGRGTLKVAAEGMGRNWRMRAEDRSPRYTTCWQELPVAQARDDEFNETKVAGTSGSNSTMV